MYPLPDPKARFCPEGTRPNQAAHTSVPPLVAGSLHASHARPLSLPSALPPLPRCALGLGCHSFSHQVPQLCSSEATWVQIPPTPNNAGNLSPPRPSSQRVAAPPAERCPAMRATWGRHKQDFRFSSSHLSGKIVLAGTQHQNYERGISLFFVLHQALETQSVLCPSVETCCASRCAARPGASLHTLDFLCGLQLLKGKLGMDVAPAVPCLDGSWLPRTDRL